jgi:hypothetical protein
MGDVVQLYGRFVSVILGVYVCVSSAEMIYRRHILRRGGLLSWEVFSLNTRFSNEGVFAKVGSVLLNYPQVLAIVLIKLLCGLVLLLSLWTGSRIHVLAVCLAALTSLLLSYRNRYGSDGADQMGLIISVALALGYLGGSNRSLSYALLFIAFQVQFAYLTAGIAKASSRKWRDGTGFRGIISTHSYGRHWLRILLERYPSLSIAMSWSVILFLVSFFSLFLLGGPFLIAAFICGICFHIGNATVMRLHTFVWSFTAAYPAVYYARHLWVNIG